jgi:hypothetical protein
LGFTHHGRYPFAGIMPMPDMMTVMVTKITRITWLIGLKLVCACCSLNYLSGLLIQSPQDFKVKVIL